MKTLLPVAVIFGLLPAAIAGCDTHTLVGREWPAGSGGSPDASPPEMSTRPGNDDASPPFIDPRTQPGKDQDAAPGYDAGTPDGGPPLNVDPPFSIPERLVGEWTGYFQAFTLMSGSDAITLDLIRTAGAPDRITVTLGVGPPPALTGPEPVWPTTGKPETSFPDYYEGLVYEAHEVKWRDNRLTFATSPHDAFRLWCPMQKIYSDGGGHYTCAAATSINLGDGRCFSENGVEVSCRQWWACRDSVCSCDANGCQARYDARILFDITFEPPPVIGAASLGSTFRITRTPTDGGAPESGQ